MSAKLERILCVDDDEHILEVATMVFEEIGDFKVKSCNSGAKAIATISSYKPQLIVLDVMMPEMDGVETAKQIYKSSEGKNIPIVFMTAKAQSHEQESYLKIDGVIGVISKPFDVSNLCDIITKMWEKNNG